MNYLIVFLSAMVIVVFGCKEYLVFTGRDRW